MSRILPTRPLFTLAALLAVAPGAYAAANDGTMAPVKGGASQVHITLTGDNGGTCIVHQTVAKAGPVTFM
jgi:iron uptake system component EfeO